MNYQPTHTERSANTTVSFSLWVITLLLMFSPGVATAAHAGTLTTSDLLTELMLQSQADNAGFIGRLFGPSPNSQLNIITNVDPIGSTFSYSLQSGTTYEGQSISLSAFATYDPTTELLSVSSIGQLGATSWTTSGSFAVTPSVNGFSATFADLLYFGAQQAPQDFLDIDGQIVWQDPVSGLSIALAHWTINHIPISNDFFMTDHRRPEDRSYSLTGFGTDFGMDLTISGSSPPNGGDGSSTVTISPVTTPESSSLLLLGSGTLGVASFLRKRLLLRT